MIMNEIISIVVIIIIVLAISSMSYIFITASFSRVQRIIQVDFLDKNEIFIRAIGNGGENNLRIILNGYNIRNYSLAPNLPYLFAHYSFNEGSGNIIHDFSGNKKDGIMYNSPQFVNGFHEYGLMFADLNDQRVQVDDFNFNFSLNRITIFLRIFTNNDQTNNDWNFFVHIRDKFNMPIIEFGTWGNNIEFKVFNNNDGYRVGPIPLEKNKWITLAGVVNGNEVKLYINGNLVDSLTGFPGFTLSDENKLFIGGWQQRVFSGIIDEVMIFSAALDNDTIKKISSFLISSDYQYSIKFLNDISGKVIICSKNCVNINV